jgi:hypothetical protein
LLLASLVHLAADGSERGAFQNLGDGIAHFLHDDSGSAGFDINAFVALSKSGFAGAGQRREGSIDHSDNGRNGDLIRRMNQHVAAAFALLAGYQAQPFQGEQNLLEKLLGDGLVFSQIADQRRPLAIIARQGVQSPKAILGALR